MLRDKLIGPRRLDVLLKNLRRCKKTIAFTNGTFDILHAGHVRYLEKASRQADVLILGLNSDASVRAYKSPDRPVNPERDRAEVLSALACIDYIVIFSDPDPLKLILRIRPDVLVKGADWKTAQIAGAREVMGWGGKVRRIPVVAGRSSTSVIERIRKMGIK